jgi:hypothetical protein
MSADMPTAARSLVVASLKELSDRHLHERFWLADREPALSSFPEAIERLFTDSGLAALLTAGRPALGEPADALLREIQEQVTRVNARLGPRGLLDDPAVARIRELACDILALLPNDLISPGLRP